MKREKNDDHKCLPTIIKLRIFIVNNQSLKLNDKQRKINKKNTAKLTYFVTSLIKLNRENENKLKKTDKTNVAKPNRETREQS